MNSKLTYKTSRMEKVLSRTNRNNTLGYDTHTSCHALGSDTKRVESLLAVNFSA